MATPTLLGLPNEIKRQIFGYLIVDKEIEVCGPYQPFSTDPGCTHRGHHSDMVRNPNRNLFLVNREFFNHARPMSPKAVDLVYSNLACARDHFRYFTRLRRAASKITITKTIRTAYGPRKLANLVKRKEAWVFLGMKWLERKVGTKASVSFTHVDAREGQGGNDFCERFVTKIFPGNKKYRQEMNQEEKARLKKRTHDMRRRRVMAKAKALETAKKVVTAPDPLVRRLQMPTGVKIVYLD